MKSFRQIFILAEHDRPAIAAIKATVGQLEGATPKVDARLHSLWRIGECGMVLVPDGIMAPTSANAKAPTKRDLPWLPPEILWVPKGDLGRRKDEERGWTQARLAEIRQLLIDAQGVTLVMSSEGSKRALDELAFELPESRRLQYVSLPAGATPEAVVHLLASAKPYRASGDAIRARRTCLALDYLVQTNFRIGVVERLREAKVTPVKGFRLTLIMAGVLGAIATTSDDDAAQRMTWRREVVVEGESGKFLALNAADPLAHDTSYAEILAHRPRSGVRGVVVGSETVELAVPPPPPMTLGGLLRGGFAPKDIELALQYLGGGGLVAHAFDGGRVYPPVDRAMIDSFIAFLKDGFDRAVLERVRSREDYAPAAPADRYAITPLIGNFTLPDLSEREQNVWRALLKRWVAQLAGPVRATARTVRVQLGGMHYETRVYTEIVDRGWCEGLPTPTDPSLWRVGEQVIVTETVVEPQFPSNRSFGELVDALSLPWSSTPWESERVPGAVVASPRSVLGALTKLVDEGLVAIDNDRAYATELGKQVLAFLPGELRHPAWVANVRTMAQRAATPSLQAMLRDDVDRVIIRYAERLEEVAVTLAPRVWTAEESSEEKKDATVAARSGMEREVQVSAGGARAR